MFQNKLETIYANMLSGTTVTTCLLGLISWLKLGEGKKNSNPRPLLLNLGKHVKLMKNQRRYSRNTLKNNFL